MSERCSGDMDPFSEFSVLGPESEELGSFVLVGRDGSTISPRAGDTIEPLFDRFGLTIGDCLTARVARGFDNAFLLAFLDKTPELFEAECWSTFMSMGEFVVAVSIWSKADACCSFCARSAGELRGLKYAPGIVYSGILK
jgi:hypothetical protein